MLRNLTCTLMVVALMPLLLCPVASAQENPAAMKPKTVYVLEIHGAIEHALLYVLRRTVAEAQQGKADALIISMDTPGGRVDAMREIAELLSGLTIPTITFVEQDAFSAGAVIALATDEIWMTPGSQIGDAMPILMSPFGGVQELPADIKEKQVSPMASLVRSLAQRHGYDEDLVECMVRIELEYKLGDKVLCKEGELLTLTAQEATQVVDEATGRTLLAAGMVDSIDELLKIKGLEGATVIRPTVTHAERVARFITGLAPIFLILGLLGIYVEVRTPGFGLPGILGAACLVIFFWGHHVAGLAGMEDLLLFILGVTLLAVELLLIPGFGVTGILGLMLMLAGLLMAMVRRMPQGPLIPPMGAFDLPLIHLGLALLGTVAGGYLLGRWLPRTSLGRRLVLEQVVSSQDAPTRVPAAADLLGRRVTTLTALRPAGSALLDGRTLDVISRGGYVEPGRGMVIAEVHGNRVVVEEEA